MQFAGLISSQSTISAVAACASAIGQQLIYLAMLSIFLKWKLSFDDHVAVQDTSRP